MKQKARAALIRPQYNVMDQYHDTGCFQRIAKSHLFEMVTLAIICANAIWMGVDIDRNPAPVLIEAPLIFQIVENAFCTYFTVELFIRFCAFRRKVLCFRDPWFVFDCVLVFMMVSETWIVTLYLHFSNSSGGASLGSGSVLRITRIVKMLRISRMARLLRSVPELLILLKGMKAASRSVFVFFMLWLLIIYCFALVFRQLAQDRAMTPYTKYFRSVPEAMNTLLLEGIFPDHAYTVNSVADENMAFYPLMMIFVIIAVLTLMNMLVGVLVEVVAAVASTEKEGIIVLHLASSMRAWMMNQGHDPETTLTKQQFQNVLVEPEVTRIINSIGVDVLVLLDMCDTIFDDLAKSGANGLTFEAFIDLILNMRGTNPAKVKDVKEQLRLIKVAVTESTGKLLEKVNSEIAGLHKELHELREEIRDDKEEIGLSFYEDGGDDVVEIIKTDSKIDAQPVLVDADAGDEDNDAEI